MQLENKTAVIYGAGGAIGEAVARAFAKEGARAFLTGKSKKATKASAKDIVSEGGIAEAGMVDALDERAVNSHLDWVVKKQGKIDISFNAMGISETGIQGIPLLGSRGKPLPIQN